TIADCLQSVVSQSYKSIEIIVVDSSSRDSTVEIAKSMGAVVIPYDGERSAARNLGAKIAKGNYLYFVDSDFKLEPDVIASCVREIAHADGVVTNERDLATGSYVSKIIALRKDILSHDSLDLALKFVRKNVFNM